MKASVVNFLKKILDLFTWAHDEIEGINPKVMSHRLSVDPKFLPKRPKRRSMNSKRYEGLKEEVNRLIKKGIHQGGSLS